MKLYFVITHPFIPILDLRPASRLMTSSAGSEHRNLVAINYGLWILAAIRYDLWILAVIRYDLWILAAIRYDLVLDDFLS